MDILIELLIGSLLLLITIWVIWIRIISGYLIIKSSFLKRRVNPKIDIENKFIDLILLIFKNILLITLILGGIGLVITFIISSKKIFFENLF